MNKDTLVLILDQVCEALKVILKGKPLALLIVTGFQMLVKDYIGKVAKTVSLPAHIATMKAKP